MHWKRSRRSRTKLMTSCYRHNPVDLLEKAGGEGWLDNGDQQKSSSSYLIRQRLMVSGSCCEPSIGVHLTTQFRRPAEGCCGITPLRCGRRCSRRVGASAFHLCVDGIPTGLGAVASSKNFVVSGFLGFARSSSLATNTSSPAQMHARRSDIAMQ